MENTNLVSTSQAISITKKSAASLDHAEKLTTKIISTNQTGITDSLHKQFLLLGRERNKITYKLLALLPQIYKEKVYEAHGYATIFEYAGKLARLSHSIVEKALKLEEKLKDKPFLQKAIETQGIHKVAIVANLAIPENEKMFADKVENLSKPALQQFSKELRGKIQTSWQIEMDEEMMIMFLKLKKGLGKFGNELSNKEAMRRLLKKLSEGTTVMAKNQKLQLRAKNSTKIPGDFSGIKQNLQKKDSEILQNNSTKQIKLTKITRYVPIVRKRLTLSRTDGKCAHKNCVQPAQIFHHQIRFSQTQSHDSLIPLCKIHHEFAHNGITEKQTEADILYRKYRQVALVR